MSEQITLARPYARAIYDLAREERRIDAWAAMLRRIAEVMAQLQTVPLYGDPRVTDAVLAEVIIDLCSDDLDGEARNLVYLLVHNRRLAILPALVNLFEHLRAQGKGEVEAEVVTARPLTEPQCETLLAALRRRFGCDVTLSVKEDESLLAGAIVRTGDLVIDGSLKGQLVQLAREINR